LECLLGVRHLTAHEIALIHFTRRVSQHVAGDWGAHSGGFLDPTLTRPQRRFRGLKRQVEVALTTRDALLQARALTATERENGDYQQQQQAHDEHGAALAAR
jgi:hypothetical protein